jgi:hypothetical protein
MTLHGVGEGVGRGVAAVGVAVEAFEADGFEVAGEGRVEAARVDDG